MKNAFLVVLLIAVATFSFVFAEAFGWAYDDVFGDTPPHSALFALSGSKSASMGALFKKLGVKDRKGGRSIFLQRRDDGKTVATDVTTGRKTVTDNLAEWKRFYARVWVGSENWTTASAFGMDKKIGKSGREFSVRHRTDSEWGAGHLAKHPRLPNPTSQDTPAQECVQITPPGILAAPIAAIIGIGDHEVCLIGPSSGVVSHIAFGYVNSVSFPGSRYLATLVCRELATVWLAAQFSASKPKVAACLLYERPTSKKNPAVFRIFYNSNGGRARNLTYGRWSNS